MGNKLSFNICIFISRRHSDNCLRQSHLYLFTFTMSPLDSLLLHTRISAQYLALTSCVSRLPEHTVNRSKHQKSSSLGSCSPALGCVQTHAAIVQSGHAA